MNRLETRTADKHCTSYQTVVRAVLTDDKYKTFSGGWPDSVLQTGQPRETAEMGLLK